MGGCGRPPTALGAGIKTTPKKKKPDPKE